MLVNESSLYKQSKFRIENLEAELLKKEKYLEAETLKKEEWEALSLTEQADVAFSGGISFDDPMQKPPNVVTPVTSSTMKYDDKVPDLNIQKPKEGRPDKDSVFGAFGGLDTKPVDYLSAVLNPFPEASAVLSEELAATDTTGEMKTIDDWMEAQKIAERDKTGQFAEELVIPTSPVDELRPDIAQVYAEEQEKAPEGMIFQGFDDYGKPSYVQVYKDSVVTRIDRWQEPGVTTDLSTGKLRHFDAKGNEIKEADRYIVTRESTPIEKDKRDSIAKQYATKPDITI